MLTTLPDNRWEFDDGDVDVEKKIASLKPMVKARRRILTFVGNPRGFTYYENGWGTLGGMPHPLPARGVHTHPLRSYPYPHPSIPNEYLFRLRLHVR